MKKKYFLISVIAALFFGSPAFAQLQSQTQNNVVACQITQEDYLINFTIEGCWYNDSSLSVNSNITSEPYPFSDEAFSMYRNGRSAQNIWNAVGGNFTPRYETHEFEVVDDYETLSANETHIVQKPSYRTEYYRTVEYLPSWCEGVSREYTGYLDYYNETANCPEINKTSLQKDLGALFDYPLKDARGFAGKNTDLDYSVRDRIDFKLDQIPYMYDAKTHIGPKSAVVSASVGTVTNITNDIYTWEWDTSTDSGAFKWYNGSETLKYTFTTDALGTDTAAETLGTDEELSLKVTSANTGDQIMLNLTRGLHASAQVIADDTTPKYLNFSWTDFTPTKVWAPGYAFYDSGDNAAQYQDLGNNNWVTLWNADEGLEFSWTDNADHGVDDYEIDFTNSHASFWIAGNTNEFLFVNWLNATESDFHTNADDPTTAYSGKPYWFYERINETFDDTPVNLTYFSSATNCKLNDTNVAGANGNFINMSEGTACETNQHFNSSEAFRLKTRMQFPFTLGGIRPWVGIDNNFNARGVSIEALGTPDCTFWLDNGTFISQDASSWINFGQWHDVEFRIPNETWQEIWIDGNQRCVQDFGGEIKGDYWFEILGGQQHTYVDWVQVPREVIPNILDEQGGSYGEFDFSSASTGTNKSLGIWYGKSSLQDATVTYQSNATVNTTFNTLSNDYYGADDMSENNVFQMGTIEDAFTESDYTITPGRNLTQGIASSSDVFYITNSSDSVFFSLDDISFNIDDPLNETYFTNNMTSNFTTDNIISTGTDCWWRLDGGSDIYLGNVTNDTRQVDFRTNNVTSVHESTIVCTNVDGTNQTSSVFYTQDLLRILGTDEITGNQTEGTEHNYTIDYVYNDDLLESFWSRFNYTGHQREADGYVGNISSGTFAGGRNITFFKSFDTPILNSSQQLKWFFWNATGTYRSNSSTFFNQSANQTQTVFQPNVDGCSAGSTVFLNYSLFNETNLAKEFGDVKLDLNYTMNNGTFGEMGFESTASHFHEFCIQPGWIELDTNEAKATYDNESFGMRPRGHFLISTTLTNSSNNVTLYTLHETEGVQVDGSVEDDSGTSLESHYLTYDLLNLSGTGSQLVAMSKTDKEGLFQAFLQANNEAETKIKILDSDGNLIFTIPSKIISHNPDSVDKPFLDLVVLEDASIDVFKRFNDIQYTLSFNNVTNISSVTAVDSGGDMDGGRYVVKETGALSDTTLCDKTGSGTSLTLACDQLGNATAEYLVEFTAFYPERNYTVVSQFERFNDVRFDHEDSGWFAGATIIMAMAGAWSVNPILGVLAGTLGFVFASLLGFMRMTTTATMGIAFSGILLAYIFNRSES